MNEAKVIPYGKGYLEFKDIKDINLEFYFIEPKYPKKKVHLKKEILRTLKNPIKKSLDRLRCESLSLVIGDDTRPIPYRETIELLISQLSEQGIAQDKIKLIIGGGLHPPMNASKAKEILGGVYDELEVVIHDSRKKSDLEFLGVTRQNTPVWINRNYLASEKRIVVGMIDPHQFVGFTGGAKGVSIGIAGYETIEANHSMMTDKNAKLGVIKNNPVRKDIDEIGKTAGIDFILNFVLNKDKEVIRAFAGDWFLAHRKGVNYLRNLVNVKAPCKTKITIVSPGGYPRDLNVYQAQKALSSAEVVTEENGVIILVAKCPEGLGDDIFEETLKKFEDPKEIINYFENTQFKMGLHKAYLWARTLVKHRVILVSDAIDSKYSDILKVKIVDSLDEAVKTAKKLQKTQKVNVIPYGNFTIPHLK